MPGPPSVTTSCARTTTSVPASALASAQSSRCPGSGAGRASSACPAPRTPRPAGRPRPARCCSDGARSARSADRTPLPAARSARCPTGRGSSARSGLRSHRPSAPLCPGPRAAASRYEIGEKGRGDQRTVIHIRLRHQRVAHLGRAVAHPARSRPPSSRRPCAPCPPPPHRGQAGPPRHEHRQWSRRRARCRPPAPRRRRRPFRLQSPCSRTPAHGARTS